MSDAGRKILIVTGAIIFLIGCENIFPPKKPKSLPNTPVPAAEVKGTVIARVNNQPITLEDLNSEIETFNSYVPQDRPEEKIDTRDKKIAYLKNEMIRRVLFAQAALDR